MNINSLLPKIDDISDIKKQSNASIIGISESKLDSTILNSELDIEDCNLIRIDHSSREVEFHEILESPYLTVINKLFVMTLKALLWISSSLNQSQFWLECYIGHHANLNL